jgi:hypothetical protein
MSIISVVLCRKIAGTVVRTIFPSFLLIVKVTVTFDSSICCALKKYYVHFFVTRLKIYGLPDFIPCF